MRFYSGIKQHQSIKAATCLMFQLAIFFRLWTQTKGQKLFDKNRNLNIAKDCISMPKEGLRHDKIIAEFVNATFANEAISKKNSDVLNLYDEQSGKSVRARIEKIDPQIRLIPWSDKSFDITLVVSEKAAKAVEKHFAKRTRKTA